MSVTQMEEQLKQLRVLQREMQECASQRETLVAQLNENELVSKELDLVEAGCEVYKLIGPVLVRQAPEEARDTVRKRLEFITGEINKRTEQLKSAQDRAIAQKDHVTKLQRAMAQKQQLQMQAQAQAAAQLAAASQKQQQQPQQQKSK